MGWIILLVVFCVTTSALALSALKWEYELDLGSWEEEELFGIPDCPEQHNWNGDIWWAYLYGHVGVMRIYAKAVHEFNADPKLQEVSQAHLATAEIALAWFKPAWKGDTNE